jgi:cell division protein FtsB
VGKELKRWGKVAYYAFMGGQSTRGGSSSRPAKRSKRRRKGFLKRGNLDLRGSWRRKKGFLAFAILGGVTALLLLSALFGEQGFLKVRHLENERAELEEKVAVLEGETRSLRGEIRGMRSDPFLYEKAARERLGLVKPGEVVYDFRDDPLEAGR